MISLNSKKIAKIINVLFVLAIVFKPVDISSQSFDYARQSGADDSLNQMTIMVRCANKLSDAEKINDAIQNSPSGSEIIICGECMINETVKLIQNRSYRGQHRSGTILKQADNANLVAIAASAGFLDNNPYTDGPVSITKLRFEGNKENNPDAMTAGLILRSWLTIAEDLHIRNMPGDGFRLTNLSNDSTGLQSTQVNGRIVNNFITGSGGHGILIEDSQNAVTDWILSDNWIASSGKDGIHLENAAGWYIERNHIYGVPQNAIYANRLWASSISNNYIEGFGEGEKSGTWHGIYATIQGGAASTIANNRIMNFNEEKHDSSQYRYLSLRVRYDTGMVIVSGNVIRSKGAPKGTGIYYEASANTKLIVSSFGNLIEDTTVPRFVGKNVIIDTGY